MLSIPASCIMVSNNVKAASINTASNEIRISEAKVMLPLGASRQLELVNAVKWVRWSSANEQIATVSEYGTVKAVSEGVTTIYAKSGGKTYKTWITVYKERLKPEEQLYELYEDGFIYVTLQNKNRWENITVTSLDTTVAQVGDITWEEDKARIFVQVKSKGETTLSIKRSKSIEPCTITLSVIDKKDRKALDATKLYEEAAKSMVEILVVTKDEKDSLGSGFFIGEGMILTNYHVIEDAASIKVLDYDEKEYTVTKVYDYNKTFDLAVIGVEGTRPALKLSEDEVVTGEVVYSLGSPYGYTGTFSKGIVGTASRIIEEIDYIQITAPISRGNSGGPLLNRFGEVIGVNTLTRVDAQNINFSVNIEYLDKLNLQEPKDIATFIKNS